ncbi:MAG: type II secretion system F family protein [Candidatus Liptonbacteria bacterium]
MSKGISNLTAFFSRVPELDIINFARHLSIVVRAGLPLLEGLKIIHRQTAKGYLKTIIEGVSKDVEGGQFLASSLQKYPYVFDPFFVNIVKVGEVSGTLPNNLLYLSEEKRKAREFRNRIRSAMVYPAIVLGAMVVIVGFLVFFIFPKVLPIFQNLQVKLPMPTKILMWTSQFLLANGYLVALGMIAFVVAFKFCLRLPAFKYLWDRFNMRVPVLGYLIVGSNVANFTRVLAVLLKSGIKIVDALNITSDTFENLVYKRTIAETAQEVSRGETLVKHLNANSRVFPPLVGALIEIGESTGNLEENLGYLAGYYNEEMDNSLRSLTALMEPILLLILGAIVGFVAISIILPIYKITQGV